MAENLNCLEASRQRHVERAEAVAKRDGVSFEDALMALRLPHGDVQGVLLWDRERRERLARQLLA